MEKNSKSCFIKLCRPWETQDSTFQRKIRRGSFSRVLVEVSRALQCRQLQAVAAGSWAGMESATWEQCDL